MSYDVVGIFNKMIDMIEKVFLFGGNVLCGEDWFFWG